MWLTVFGQLVIAMTELGVCCVGGTGPCEKVIGIALARIPSDRLKVRFAGAEQRRKTKSVEVL